MGVVSQATNTPPQDTIDRVQQCQDLLMEVEELGKQKEVHDRLLARYEGKVQEKTFESTHAKLMEHKHQVMGLLNNIKKLQSAYGELMLGLWRKDANLRWIRLRRRRLLTAFHLVKDIHVLIMQNGGDITPSRKRKRSAQRYRRSQRSRKR